MANVERVEQLRRALWDRDGEEAFNMWTWVDWSVFERSEEPQDPKVVWDCNTPACLAGYACMLREMEEGGQLRNPLCFRDSSYAARAQEWLEITDDEADALFEPMHWPFDVWVIYTNGEKRRAASMMLDLLLRGDLHTRSVEEEAIDDEYR